MRRIYILVLFALLAPALAGCELGTDPADFSLSQLATPPRDHATFGLTEDLTGPAGDVIFEAGTQYFLPLREPPPLPELLFIHEASTASVQVVLSGVHATGTMNTSDEGVALRFSAPDGSLFEPRTSCRITVVSALLGDGTGRLQGHSDCPATNGTTDLRVLLKFDYTHP